MPAAGRGAAPGASAAWAPPAGLSLEKTRAGPDFALPGLHCARKTAGGDSAWVSGASARSAPLCWPNDPMTEEGLSPPHRPGHGTERRVNLLKVAQHKAERSQAPGRWSCAKVTSGCLPVRGTNISAPPVPPPTSQAVAAIHTDHGDWRAWSRPLACTSPTKQTEAVSTSGFPKSF